MPKFEKTILKEGRYRQWDDIQKKYVYVTLTADRIRSLSSSFQKMKEKGIRVPAPWKHDFEITSLVEGDNGLLEDSTKNAGFWDDLVAKVTDDGKYGLVGIIDAPGDPNDTNTPAGKVGKTVKDTSIYTRKNVPITSGSEEVLEEAIMHIALVTHPIELNQENFKLKDSTETHLVMSNMVGESESEDSETEEIESEDSSLPLNQLINDLRDTCKLYVPPNTTIDNFVENLSIAVNQYKLLNTETPNSDPDSFEVEPLLMSHLQPSQIDALIAGKVTNPLTNKPYAKEDFAQAQPQQSTQDQLIMSAMQNSMQSDRRKSYRSRIDSLVGSGRTTKAFAEQKLYPQADNYVIQFDNGQIVEPVVESLIMSLESMPAPTPAQDQPLVMSFDTSSSDDETIKKTAAYMASLV